MLDQPPSEEPTATALPDIAATLARAGNQADRFVTAATDRLRTRLCGPDGRIDRKAADRDQHAVHGLGWYATYAATLQELAGWAERLSGKDEFGETEGQLAQLLACEYAGQIVGGIPMNQGETIRPFDLTDDADDLALLDAAPLADLARRAGDKAVRIAIAHALIDARGRATLENSGLDETQAMIRDQFFAFTRDRIAPHAHQWHLDDALIPMEVVETLGEMGVFGLTIPEEYGGLGMGKTAMCVVSEELSRGWIGIGSLATRSEIAAELILTGGTEEQRAHHLPRIASTETLPTAVFTEPDTGSDLGALRTRAKLDGDQYRIDGNKTWITHAARADLMTLLVRTDSATDDYRGLSMLLAPKARGTQEVPFPDDGISGGEIEVIGYRGMKEYELAFDGFAVPADALLGGEQGKGFKQLMETFESARIQTAARAVGVAQSALDIALDYAIERKQFGRSIIEFPRVANKLAMMAAEIAAARQLTYFAARRKDEGRRCDLEAGMAKLLGARIAWAAADNAVQIHGGNGFATEYAASRLLADARILNIFEGAGEIQAQVIGRRLLSQAN